MDVDSSPGIGPARYVGQSRFIRLWPPFMIGVAAIQLLADPGLLFYAVVFAGSGLLFAAVLPWRFVVVDEGIGLWFTFGKRRFLRKSEIVVRAGLGGAVAYRSGNRRFGYPLTDGLIENRRMILRAVLAEHGFRLA